jgi:hypothetical protein
VVEEEDFVALGLTAEEWANRGIAKLNHKINVAPIKKDALSRSVDLVTRCLVPKNKPKKHSSPETAHTGVCLQTLRSTFLGLISVCVLVLECATASLRVLPSLPSRARTFMTPKESRSFKLSIRSGPSKTSLSFPPTP